MKIFQFKHLPNWISAARLAAVPVLLTLIFLGQERPFAWLLLASLASDIVDGLIARGFHLESKLGAFLDSMADMSLHLTTLIALVVFQRPFIWDHHLTLLLVVGLYFGVMGLALWRYGRISSFHTYLCRITAYAMGIFVLSLFLFGFVAWLFYLAATIAVLGYLEEFALLAVLPVWESDVRGLYWVLQKKRR